MLPKQEHCSTRYWRPPLSRNDLAQQLRLPRRRHGPTVTCIGGSTRKILTKGFVSVKITDTSPAGKVHPVEAIVLSTITSNTPAYPVSMRSTWKLLRGLSLADREYGTPGAVDLLLGANVFSRVVLHGRRFEPLGSEFRYVQTCSLELNHRVLP